MARAPFSFSSRHHGAGRARRVFAPLLALAAVCALLAGCAFQPGGEQIAWQRGDQLWVANPDGSAARQLAPNQVAGYAWSPDHRELVFRYAKSVASLPAGAPWAAPETVSELAVVSNSGGQPTQITPGGGLTRSDAWWDPQGNRLLYREYGGGAALAPIYFDSQNDQPIGIARKVILDAASMPTLAPDGQRVAVINAGGDILVGAPAQTGKVVARGAALTLPGSDRPARLLWRPGHNALVYFTASDAPNATTLRLLDLDSGASSFIISVSGVRDAAFSPDGATLLIQISDGMLIWPLDQRVPRASILESDSVAQTYWSPDSRWLLVEDDEGLRLYSAASHWNAQAALTFVTPLGAPVISATTPWRPATANPWSPDGASFVFASGPAAWMSQGSVSLRPSPAGIYVERVSASGPDASPTLIASGNVSAPSWGYSDPSTVLLMPTR